MYIFQGVWGCIQRGTSKYFVKKIMPKFGEKNSNIFELEEKKFNCYREERRGTSKYYFAKKTFNLKTLNNLIIFKIKVKLYHCKNIHLDTTCDT